jgi:hypothetical protein
MGLQSLWHSMIAAGGAFPYSEGQPNCYAFGFAMRRRTAATTRSQR